MRIFQPIWPNPKSYPVFSIKSARILFGLEVFHFGET